MKTVTVVCYQVSDLLLNTYLNDPPLNVVLSRFTTFPYVVITELSAIKEEAQATHATRGNLLSLGSDHVLQDDRPIMNPVPASYSRIFMNFPG